MKNKGRISIIIGLIAAVLAILPSNFEWFRNIESSTWDWRVTYLADPDKKSDEIVVILLDQKSLDWVQEEQGLSHRWPRELYAAILSYCHESGAKAVGFDLLFTDPSFIGVEDDLSFGEAAKSFGRVVLPVESRREKSTEKEFVWPQFYTEKIKKISSIQNKRNYKTYDYANLPIEEIASQVHLVCHVNSLPDDDGVNRSALLLAKVGNKLLPSLGLATYLAGNKGAEVEVTAEALKIGSKSIPLDDQGASLIRLRGPSKTHTAFSAASILQSYLRVQEGEEPVVAAEKLKDKYILFGYSAAGLHDQHTVSFGDKYPGVEVHATVIDNIINEDFFREAPPFVNYVAALLLALIAPLLLLKSGSHFKQGLIMIILITCPTIIAFLSASAGYKTALFFPTLAISSSLFLSVGYNYLTEGRQKRFIKHAFNHYLSPHVIEQMIDNPEKLKLGGERTEISIFFSDLQGFTSISEKLSPEVLIDLLNEYLSAMSEIILEEQGTIDKYEGDAIIAFWNAPLPVENHAVQIVKSALKCQKVLAEMNPELKKKAQTDLKMRIGIHTGPAVVGNMGAAERFDYTMLGDSVNLAARLEGVNKQFGTFTMISEETKKQIGDAYPTRELAKVEVVGRKKPVVVYEPMLHEEYEQRKEYLETFDKALQYFYKENFVEALKIFESNSKNDPPSKFYAKKCRMIIEGGLNTPEGIWVMTSK